MTRVRIVFVGISITFWQLVSATFAGYALAFIFWPTDMNKLFTTPLPENAVRLIGTTLLFVDAGINQMVEKTNTSYLLVRQMAYISSMVQYILAASAGLTIVSLEPSVFIREQRIAFQVIYSFFIAVLLLRVFTGCVLAVQYTKPRPLETVKVYQVSTLKQFPVQRGHSRTIREMKSGR